MKYCAYAALNPPSSEAFCVDSYGFADKVNFAGISCGGEDNICVYSSCPDFNNNGWVECQVDLVTGEPIFDGCPAGPEQDASDYGCIVNCWGADSDTPVGSLPDCGISPCTECPDDIALGGDGDGFMNECVEVYDISGNGSIDFFDLFPGLFSSFGKSCE